MDFRVLGPLEVRTDGHQVELGGRRRRALLALLLLHRGEAIAADRLAEELWGEEAPNISAKTLQAHVSRLRSALGEDDPDGAAMRIETTSGGYRLVLRPDELDLDRFRRHCADGRAALADGDPARAVAALEAALELWRGPALADLAYEPFAQRQAARLEEERLCALEDRLSACLGLGRHAEVVSELLRTAALLGREFELPVLLAVTPDDGATLDALERAERARLLHAVPEAAGRFAFYHELVVQALADDIPVSARMREHERIALALAARGAAAPQLARHFSEAAPLGHATAARRRARAASDEAMAVFAFELAAEHYARARWAHALAASPDEAEGVALDVLGRLERLLGRLDEAERRLRDAAALCERMGAQAHLSLARHELAGVLVASGRGPAEAQRLAEAAAGLGVALPQWAPVTTSTRRQSGSSR